MSEQLVVVGAGYVGVRLAEEVLDRGWEVVGTGKSQETTEALDDVGAEAVEWNVLEDDAGRLEGVVDEGASVVYSVPSLFREHEPGAGADARHVAPVADALEAAAGAGADEFVYLSSTSVYGDHDGGWVDEETPTDPVSPNGKMRRDVEAFLLDGEGSEVGPTTRVVRLVGIYGPGRTMVDYLESGRYKLVDGGVKPTNRIHVDDIVAGLAALVEKDGDAERLYNFSDGSPKRVVDVVDWLVERLGIERPPEIDLEDYADSRGENAAARWATSYRVGNDRMVEDLGVDLAYPDVYAGYGEILGLEPPN